MFGLLDVFLLNC